MKYRFSYQQKEEYEIPIDNHKLIQQLSIEKTKIDKYPHKWNKIKKNIHDYEYIYTSPNFRKNIGNFLPISRSYFKLKEMASDYNIFQDKEKLKVYCMAEAPGGFIQCMLENKKKIIEINATTLYSNSKEIPEWSSKIKRNRFINFCWGVKNDGDLYSIENILSLIKGINKSSIDIITGDGGLDTSDDYNNQEKNSLSLIYSEIFLALNLQKKGGTFICKVFDIFLKETIKLLYILTISYENIYIHKPKFSRLSNSEKYIVCMNFKGYNKEIVNKLFHSFDSKNINTEVNSNFLKELNNYNSLYLDIQTKQIQRGIDLICDMKKSQNYPSSLQKQKAIDWCNKYNIGLNKECYYLQHTITK